MQKLTQRSTKAPCINGLCYCFIVAVEFNASHPADWVDPQNWCPTDTEQGGCKQVALLDSEKIPCRTNDVVFPTGSSYYVNLGTGLPLNIRTLKVSGKVCDRSWVERVKFTMKVFNCEYVVFQRAHYCRRGCDVMTTCFRCLLPTSYRFKNGELSYSN